MRPGPETVRVRQGGQIESERGVRHGTKRESESYRKSEKRGQRGRVRVRGRVRKGDKERE